VLTLADRAYARLENTGGGDYYFWGRTLKKTPVAAELRRVGAIIRQRSAASSRPSR
jgi:hypothetical protein